MDAWIITLVNQDFEIIEDLITYDESTVDGYAQELRDMAKPTEHVAIGHVTLELPFN